MRDPAYYILIGIIVLFVLDHFLFQGVFLNFVGRNVNNMVSWISGLMGG